jgi:ABC transporter DrrB family efflux protein
MMTSLTATEIATPARSQRARWFVSDTVAMAGRNLQHVRQIPEKLLDVTLQPIMFVLLFAFVFGNVIHVPGGDYRSYLIGGILIQSLGFGMMGPGTSIATDLGEGMVDRIRSLPTSRTAYLAGHFLAELMATLVAIVILCATGFAIGWSIHGSVLDTLEGVALLVAFASAMIWLGTLVGVIARSADAVQGFAFMVIFPMTFLSNVFVPAAGLSSGLRQIAEWNPISSIAAAVRTLFGNPTAIPHNPPWPLAHPVAAAFMWTAFFLAVAVPLTIWRFRARTTE